ncbi:hypothetical protein PIB30_074095 [Stylosanthes scabra]|uniref:Uncharacterized protein n=1 Tax=Stylosanthes scabra TaxID=79078 RepID=A0ABU6RQB3_9FABA|nr:hypothetical protein [Stylosanthes scabra]
MGKKRSCQDVKVSRPLNAANKRLYGWVEEAMLAQPSVVESDTLPEFRHNFQLMGDSGAEGDYVLEAAGLSDRVPFRADEGDPYFLWVYQELFTRLRVRLPFSDFQRDVMTRCRVAVSQLHLNGWGFILTFEKVAFPESFNYRKALDASLASAPVREALVKMPPKQLLGESYNFSAKSLACLQVSVETSLAAKVKAEKELSAALDQIEILKGERDSALAFLPFKDKVDNLDDQLSKRTAEYQSALEQIAQLEEDNGVLKTILESSQLSLEGEKKRSEAAENQAGSFAASLKTCQTDLSKATEAYEYWRAEWQKLGTEVTEMCQETLDICLDQVSHLCPGVDFSSITLKSRWDLKGRRIYVPQESDVEEEPPRAKEVVPEQHPEVIT